jgi:hypothetical protein
MECPAGTVTAVVQQDATREAAFRFLRNAHVGVGALGRSSHLPAIRRCQGEDTVFVAVDQCSIAVTDRAGKKDFGPVGTRPNAQVRGLQAMTALAISESGRVLGVCGHRRWRRSDQKSPRFGQDKRTAPGAGVEPLDPRTERCKWKLGAEPTIEQFVLLVANMGGYTGRSSGGPPGSIVIARGFDRVTAAAAAFAAASGIKI